MSQAGKTSSPPTLLPYTSVFAYSSANQLNVTGDGTVATVALNAELYDITNDFNTATYTFTAPATGYYLVIIGLGIDGLTAAHTLSDVAFVTSNRTYSGCRLSPGAVRTAANRLTYGFSVMADFDAGDTATLTIAISNGTKVVDVLASAPATAQLTFLSIRRVY